MASKFLGDREENVQLRPRKGHDMAWSCDIHAEPIAFYCREHDMTICHRCATKDHQKPCKLDDIEDVILGTRRKLDNKSQEIEETKSVLKRYESEIQSCENRARNHLQSVNDEVTDIYNGKLKSVQDKEIDEIRLINKEADEDIRIINEKRDKLIKARNEEAHQQQLIIKENQGKFMSETKTISGAVAKKIDLKSELQHKISLVDSIDYNINRIKQDDKTLVNEAPQVIASLESLSSNCHYFLADCLDRIERKVQRVKFVDGEVGGEHYARIDDYIGKWELVKSINVPLIVNEPHVRALISDDEICVTDGIDKSCYVTNLSSKLTEKVIDGDSNMFITSCVAIDSNVIVCGKGRISSTDDSLNGYITLYDRQWKVIRDIIIPRNESYSTEMYFDTDRDGMILAAEFRQSHIYVINPADGKIEYIITIQGKVVWDRIQALPSGDILVETDDDEFTVISRSGEEKAVIHCDEWEFAWCHVDKLTGTLYVTYWDRELDMYAVDQVSCDGNIQARRIVEYVQSDHSPDHSPCLVTPSGNLVACDGDTFFVYKKTFL